VTLTVRSATVSGATTKGSALTHAELDENFNHLSQSSNHTFTPSGIAGSSASTVAEKIRNSVPVDVKSDFDATGAGVADDTTAIQAAFDSGATRVYIPAGTYLCNDLNPPSNIEIYGEGDATILKLNANADVIKINGKSNVYLHDFKIDGLRATYTTTTNDGIDVNWVTTAGSNVKIKNVTIRDCAGCGIQALAASGQPSTDFRVEHCDVEDVGASGIIAQDYISNVFLTDNRVKDWGLGVSDRVGIVASRSGSNVVISDNIVIGSASALGTSVHAISIDRTTNVACQGNVVQGAIGFGIEVGIVTSGSITGNSVNGCTRASIAITGALTGAERSRNISIVGNALYDGDSQGIYATITSGDGTVVHENITIAGNSIYDHTNTTDGFGMQLEFCDKLNVNGNSVYNSGLAGIYFVDCVNFFIDGNTVVNNNCGTIQTVTSLTLSASTATATIVGHGYSTGNTITIFGANPVEYNGSHTITVTDADNFTYTAQSGIASPAVGVIKAVKPTNTAYAGIRVSYSAISTKNQWQLGRNYVFGNGFREVYDVSVNGFAGVVNDYIALKEAKQPRVENLTSGESANILDRAALFVKNNKLVIAYNNAGTLTYLTIDLDGSDTTWAQGTSTP
jgi:parallel beta-helix repeat protein